MVKSSTVAMLLLCSLALSTLFRNDLSELWHKTEPFEVHGHRGALGSRPPGNTLTAFEEGARLGATTIECDLRLSEDGQLVAGHDPALASNCSRRSSKGAHTDKRAFSKLTLGQIQQFDCHPELPGNQPPPSLSEILDWALERDLKLNIEMKPRGRQVAERLSQVLTERNEDCDGCLSARITAQSFHAEHLKLLAQRAQGGAFRPRLSFLSKGTTVAELMTMKPYVDVYSPRAAGLDKIQIEELSRHGMRVIPWTVNAPGEMCRLAQLGIHGLITDFPSRAASLAQKIEREGRPIACNESGADARP